MYTTLKSTKDRTISAKTSFHNVRNAFHENIKRNMENKKRNEIVKKVKLRRHANSIQDGSEGLASIESKFDVYQDHIKLD